MKPGVVVVLIGIVIIFAGFGGPGLVSLPVAKAV
jgi:hypothetical protein